MSTEMASPNEDEIAKARRRLSIFASRDGGVPPEMADGVPTDKTGNQELQSTLSQPDCIVEFSVKSQVGHIPFNAQKVNQDRGVAEVGLGPTSAFCFGALDGHGIRGEAVSGFIHKHLPGVLESDLEFRADPATGWVRVFENLTNSLAMSAVNTAFSGTTAVVSWIDKGTIWTANVGDSRAVIGACTADGWAAIPLSTDQKPDDPAEKARITRMNGRVEPCKGVLGDPIGPHRVWLQKQDMPGLAMSRSFGDDVATSVGVTSVPEVTRVELAPEHKFIIWATDGVWEFISNEEAVQMIKDCETAGEAAEVLCAEAGKCWRREEEVTDDITAVVAFLNVRED